MTQIGFKSEISILVASCDKYQGLWSAWHENFKLFWNDCPYPIFLGANQLTFRDPNKKIITLQSDPDKSWSDCLSEWLLNIHSEYVLLLLDDFMLNQPVDFIKVQSLLQIMQKYNSPYMRIFPFPRPTCSLDNERNISKIELLEQYSISLQASLWKLDFLKMICSPGESPWEFEIYGSLRATEILKTSDYTCLLSCFREMPITYCEHIIDGGFLVRTRLWQVKTGQELLNSWPRLPLYNEALLILKFYLSRIIDTLPGTLRDTFLRWIRAIGFNQSRPSYIRKTQKSLRLD